MHLVGIRPFGSEILRDLYVAALYLLALSECVILILSRRNSAGEKKSADRGSRAAIVCGFAAVGFVCSLGVFGYALPAACSLTGVVLLFLGIALRCWAVWTLRRFFTLSVQTTGEQKLVRNGPYRLIRHPAYTGSILQLLGIALGIRSLPGLLCAAAVSAAVYGYRIRTEETALRDCFGRAYEEYCANTWRLFPYLF